MAHSTIKRGGTRIAKQSEAKRKKNPVDNVAFYNELSDYLSFRKSEVEAGREVPQIPDCIGSKIYMIADILSKKFYFIGYSYIEEMKMDAVLDCIRYLDKFNPEKYNNPFSYFTQVCFYAFIRRIQTEKKVAYTKSQIVKNLGSFFEELTLHESDLDAEYHTTMGEILSSQGDENLERLFGKKPKKSKAKEESHADFFSEEDDIDIDATIALHNVVEGLTVE